MIYITSRESFRIPAVLMLVNAVLTLANPAAPVSASEDARPSLPKFITYGSWDEVRECQDPLSYMCGSTKNDKCVSPKDFCDGVTSCDTAWDEKDCDKALPAYRKTEKPLKTTRLYWISMSVTGCAKLCDNTPGCRGFSHHHLYKKCQIHTEKGDETSLSTKWTSYERTSPSEPGTSRAARYLFDLAETSADSSEVVQARERRQASHNYSGSHRGAPERSGVAQTRSRSCGGQPVFYMPPRKQLQATTRIVGGSEVPYGAFPWQAEIKVLEDGYRTHHCGGAVISQRHILTAAHCVVSHNKDDYMVILGDHDLDRQDPFESTFFIDKIIVHPGYDKATKKHDIAILKLRPSLRKQTTYNEKTRPVCLPSSVTPRAGTECVVTGWGLMNPNDDASLATSLRAAMVGIIDVEDCKSEGVYGNKKNFNADGMMCAGYLRGGVDACKGDSGGPLACKINGKFQIMGVVSWGDSCAEANKPGVYTRVSQYVDWINSNMV